MLGHNVGQHCNEKQSLILIRARVRIWILSLNKSIIMNYTVTGKTTVAEVSPVCKVRFVQLGEECTRSERRQGFYHPHTNNSPFRVPGVWVMTQTTISHFRSSTWAPLCKSNHLDYSHSGKETKYIQTAHTHRHTRGSACSQTGKNTSLGDKKRSELEGAAEYPPSIQTLIVDSPPLSFLEL